MDMFLQQFYPLLGNNIMFGFFLAIHESYIKNYDALLLFLVKEQYFLYGDSIRSERKGITFVDLPLQSQDDWDIYV